MTAGTHPDQRNHIGNYFGTNNGIKEKAIAGLIATRRHSFIEWKEIFSWYERPIQVLTK